jgi:hypothetical protein
MVYFADATLLLDQPDMTPMAFSVVVLLIGMAEPAV